MNFIARPVDIFGMSLAFEVDNLDIADVITKFSSGHMESWGEVSDGYSNLEVGFVCEETGETFYVYARWGMVRIGAHNPDSAGVRELASFLMNRLSN